MRTSATISGIVVRLAGILLAGRFVFVWMMVEAVPFWLMAQFANCCDKSKNNADEKSDQGKYNQKSQNW